MHPVACKVGERAAVVSGSRRSVEGRVPSETWFTVIVKAASDALTVPSVTLITMFEYVPALAAAGVPVSCPFEGLKLAQLGLP